jgi:hypothetical protein
LGKRSGGVCYPFVIIIDPPSKKITYSPLSLSSVDSE